MEQEEERTTGKQALPTMVAQLVFELSDGLQRANAAVLALREYEDFAHQNNALAEDADQLLELRGDMLDLILETWRTVETKHADELRISRRVREELARKADEDFLNRRGR